MAKESSEKTKKNIEDMKSDALDKISAIKDEAAKRYSEENAKKKAGKSLLVMVLSFFEDLVKAGSDLLITFTKAGIIGKKTMKNTKRRVMKSFVFIVLVLFGVVLMLSGLVRYLEFMVPQLSNGLGFVFVGLIIISVAYLYKK